MKSPKNALQLIEHLLPKQSTPHTSEGTTKEYTVDELARAGNTTSRNIRAYQDKGVLSPPLLRGRKGIYNNSHLARLNVIANLLERGYTLSSIKDLLQALEQGIGLEELVGIESAISSPWGSEEMEVSSMLALTKMFGDALTPTALKMAIDLELMKPDGVNMQISSMQILKAGAELTATGIPLEELLEILRKMRGNVENVANDLVTLVGDHVLGQYSEGNIPPKEELPKIAEMVWRLRPLAESAVLAELARAMENSANKILADKLEQIIKEFQP